MSSRGLPGFLRRTRRGDIDESDDDVDEKAGIQRPLSSINNSNSNATLATPLSSSTPASVIISDSIEPELEGESITEASFKSEFSVTLDSTVNVTDDTLAANARQDSFNSSSASQNNLTSSKRITYRESQFNKVLGAPVVKLPELRNLGWNGIPVSGCNDSDSLLNNWLTFRPTPFSM